MQSSGVGAFQNSRVPVEMPQLPEEYPDYSDAGYWDRRYDIAIKSIDSKIHSYLQSPAADKAGRISVQTRREVMREEWYLTFEEVMPYLRKVDNLFDDSGSQLEDAEILIVGCGTSNISE